ncbi:cupin domain-containing protein [Aquirufa ecclesiirivi]|uniref:cupin domain-containing protein n=1 Tax=Aquirufa ecclesiirivi TaxID=2715124 RepID=UPI003BAF55D0
MKQSDIKPAQALIIVEIIEYVPNSIVSRTILKKSTGNVSLISLDTGEALTENISPFDTFVQIIDGRAEITIDGVRHSLVTGQGIIIPAHKSQIVSANERFKMISTVIKSGYES